MDTNRFVRIKYPPAPRQETKTDSKVMESSHMIRSSAALGRSRKERARNRKGRGRALRAPSKLPPDLDTVVKAHSVVRFTATAAASNVNVTTGTLLVSFGAICSIVNSTVVSVASTVKLHKITIWPATTSAGAGQQAEILWSDLGGITKDESKSRALPVGITATDVVIERPPKETQAAFWQSSSGASSNLFAITCPAGSIIDVSATWTLRNNISGVTQAGYASATLAAFYYGRLDGVGGKFLPLGVPTTN